MSDLLPIADGPELRRQALAASRAAIAAPLVGVLVLHALAAAAGLVGAAAPRAARPGRLRRNRRRRTIDTLIVDPRRRPSSLQTILTVVRTARVVRRSPS